MKDKLTLSISKKIKERAKVAASKRGKSISQLVEEYLNEISLDENDSSIPEDSITHQLSGSVNAPKTNYKTDLIERLEEKYG